MPYIQYSHLVGAKPTLGEVATALAKFDPLHTAVLLSRMNRDLRQALSGYSSKATDYIQGYLVANLFSESALAEANVRFAKKNLGEYIAFHPVQLLFALTLTAAHAKGTKRPDTGPPMYELGDVLLKINDLLLTDNEKKNILDGSDDQRRRHLMLQFLPLHELINPPNPFGPMARAYIMFNQLLGDRSIRNRLEKQTGLNFHAEFAASTGMTLATYLTFTMAVHSYYMGQDFDDVVKDPSLSIISRRSFLKNSNASQADFEKFLNLISQSISDISTSFHSQSRQDPRFAFVSYKDKPVLDLENGNYALIDASFLEAKLYEGIHWSVHNALERSRRNALFTYWGLLFEEYVNLAILNGLPPEYRWYPFPKWRSGGEAFDGLISKDKSLLALQFKGGFLTQTAKYSASLDALEEDLDLKFGSSEEGAVTQMVRSIGKLLIDKTDGIVDSDVTHPDEIYPVLVTQEHALGGPLINWWINCKFQDSLARLPMPSSITIHPITVIPIQQFEYALGAARSGRVDLLRIFRERVRVDPQMLETFGGIVAKRFPGYGATPIPLLVQAWKELLTDYEKLLEFKQDA